MPTKALRKNISKVLKKSKLNSWKNFTSECDDTYKLKKIIFKKQQNSLFKMEAATQVYKQLIFFWILIFQVAHQLTKVFTLLLAK